MFIRYAVSMNDGARSAHERADYERKVIILLEVQVIHQLAIQALRIGAYAVICTAIVTYYVTAATPSDIVTCYVKAATSSSLSWSVISNTLTAAGITYLAVFALQWYAARRIQAL